MKTIPKLCSAITIGAASVATSAQGSPHVYSNEEQVYFDADAGKQPVPWLSLKIGPGAEPGSYLLQSINAFGQETGVTGAVKVGANGEIQAQISRDCTTHSVESAETATNGALATICPPPFTVNAISDDAVEIAFADGKLSTLKRARPVLCWAAVRKDAPKPDGTIDWYYRQDISLHDQGGRATIGGGETGAPELTLRIRAVYWPPPSPNKPSMVLYIHTDSPTSAVSYSWADIDASRVGLNLRWMQASCSIEGAERGAQQETDDEDK